MTNLRYTPTRANSKIRIPCTNCVISLSADRRESTCSERAACGGGAAWGVRAGAAAASGVRRRGVRLWCGRKRGVAGSEALRLHRHRGCELVARHREVGRLLRGDLDGELPLRHGAPPRCRLLLLRLRAGRAGRAGRAVAGCDGRWRAVGGVRRRQRGGSGRVQKRGGGGGDGVGRVCALAHGAGVGGQADGEAVRSRRGGRETGKGLPPRSSAAARARRRSLASR